MEPESSSPQLEVLATWIDQARDRDRWCNTVYISDIMWQLFLPHMQTNGCGDMLLPTKLWGKNFWLYKTHFICVCGKMRNTIFLYKNLPSYVEQFSV
jgi:hypothetical protein